MTDIYKKFNKNVLDGSENGQVTHGENININLQYKEKNQEKRKKIEKCCNK